MPDSAFGLQNGASSSARPSRYAAELNPQEKALEFHLVLPGFCLMRPDGFDVDMDPVGSFPQMLQTRMQQVAMIRKALDMTKKAHAGQARLEVQGAEWIELLHYALIAFATLKKCYHMVWCLSAFERIVLFFICLSLVFSCCTPRSWAGAQIRRPLLDASAFCSGHSWQLLRPIRSWPCFWSVCKPKCLTWGIWLMALMRNKLSWVLSGLSGLVMRQLPSSL